MMEGIQLEKRWAVNRQVSPESAYSQNSFSEVEQIILMNRGIHTEAQARHFIGGFQLEGTDPFRMLGMKKAVQRVLNAIEGNEKIVVYGDYDADGVTATALLVENLLSLGGIVTHYIPDRFREGYGLNNKALERIRDNGSKVILTVDCGIRAIEEVEYAKKLDLDVVITDHHQPGPELPQAFSVIDPKQEGDEYPCKDLAGVGIAYKMAEALCRESRRDSYRDSLDLVAIGTIADMAPLVNENRYLVQEGLKVIRDSNRPGIINLCRESGYNLDRINATGIGFGIGPRINAAGRMDSAEAAFQLLLTRDDRESNDLAASLERLNQERRRIMSQNLEKARQIGVTDKDEIDFIFVADAKFHEGTVGLVASRLVDEFYRPAIVAVKGDSITRASGRSVPEFHLTNALEDCADILERFGGHSAAAGFSVKNRYLGELKKRLREIAASKLAGMNLQPSINLDAVVNFGELTWQLQEFIDSIEPCGEGNPIPQFATANVKLLGKRKVGKDGSHLKLTLEQEGKVFDAIAFRKGEMFPSIPKYVDIAFQLERSDYWNTPSLELNILDIKVAGYLKSINRQAARDD